MKTKKLTQCPKCGNKKLVRRITTYPVKLENRQINCGRVAVQACTKCNLMVPTEAGLKKVNRLLGTVMHLFSEGNLNSV